MRIKTLHWATCLLLWCILSAARADAQFLNWSYKDIVTDTVQSGAYSDMKIAADGTIHISYWQRVEDKLIYAWKGPADVMWHYEYVDATNENGFRSSICLDATGSVYIAYYESVNSEIGIRYAKRMGANNWVIESLPNIYGRGYGDYGPLGTLTSKERLQHSLELVFDENNKPQIAFFDGWMAENAFPACAVSSIYSLQMHQAIRVNNVWLVRAMGRVSDIHQSCGEFATRDSLPTGDRYGEYLDMLVEADGTMDIFSLSRFNNQIIRHRNLFPFVDTVWVRTPIDSLNRLLPGWTNGWPSFTRFYTLEGISATSTADNNIHLAYTSSIFYGDNFCCASITNDMVYCRLNANGTHYYHQFGTSTYRNYTDIVTHGGSDSLFILYSDLSNLYFIIQESADSGHTWTADTILSGIGIGRNHLAIHDDSLHALIFDATNERLLLSKRHVNGGNWRIEEVTRSQSRGQSMDGNYVLMGNDTILHTAYNDGYTGNLYYTTGSKSAGWAWSTTQLDPTAVDANAVSLASSSSGEPVVVYNGGPARDLRIAIHNGSGWQYSLIVPGGNPQYTDVAISSMDSIHVIYYDGNQNCLHRASRHLNGTAWQFEDIACDTSSVGFYPSLVLDAAGLPHVSYYNDIDRSLYYAYLDGGTRQWVIDSVNGGTSSAIGKYSSLVLDAAGNPKIAYLNEQSDVVLLSEWSQSGSWTHTAVDSLAIANIGRPIELQLDDFGKVWIAYNYYSNFEKVKLMHRDGLLWREVAVNPTGRIANAFKFRVIGGDLYVVGKKNEIQNTGMAMLYAPAGVFVEAMEADVLTHNVSIKSYPNPSGGAMTFEIDVKQPAKVSLEILDLLGHRVGTVLQGDRLGAGTHLMQYDGTALAPGIYLYELNAGSGRTVSKMVIAR
jgi:Secretion system C-terminal sorting domain